MRSSIPARVNISAAAIRISRAATARSRFDKPLARAGHFSSLCEREREASLCVVQALLPNCSSEVDRSSYTRTREEHERTTRVILFTRRFVTIIFVRIYVYNVRGGLCVCTRKKMRRVTGSLSLSLGSIEFAL